MSTATSVLFVVDAVDQVTDAVDELLAFAHVRLSKAQRSAAAATRDDLLERVLPGFAADVAEYFKALAGRLLGKVSKIEAFDLDPDTSINWTIEDDELQKVLVRWYATLGDTAYSAVAGQLRVDLRFDLEGPGAAKVRDFLANQVTGINATSRERLRKLVVDAVDRGLSVDDFRDELRSLVEGWASTPEDGGVARAQAIALTETANGYNQASIAAYEESGLVDQVEVFDGPECGWEFHDDPDLADRSFRTLDEARDFPISHPNCQRAFGPVVER